jgi:hypothetical protein
VQGCAQKTKEMNKKIIGIVVLVLLVAGMIWGWWRFYFVFGEGVKAGQLNFIVKKGYVFKTWEGRLIQEGLRTSKPGSIQSNEFEFSVENDSIAKVLELSGGKLVELRYKEHLHSIMWRGNSKYVVTEIVSIEDRAATPKLQNTGPF